MDVAWVLLRALTTAALLVALLPGPAQGAPIDPVNVALEALPDALRSAIREAQSQLLADRAQRQLEDTYAYVQGFAALPPGQSGLQDEEVRFAYAWTEKIVSLALVIPRQLEDAESASASCTSYFDDVPIGEGQATVRNGLSALTALQGMQSDLLDLLQAPPRLIDAGPVQEALTILENWQLSGGTAATNCLTSLAPLVQVDVDQLQARVVPSASFPTGTIRIYGIAQGGTITADSEQLQLHARTMTEENGAFRIEHRLPPSTPLGRAVIAVGTPERVVHLNLTVGLASTHLLVQAPSRVATNQSFTIQIAVQSPAAIAQVDEARVRVSWNGQAQTLSPMNGRASAILNSGNAGQSTLEVEVLETAVLSDSSDSRRIEVVAVGKTLQSPPAEGPEFGLMAGGAVIAAFALIVLFLAWQRRSRRVKSELPSTLPSVERNWDSFQAAIAQFFERLRQQSAIPPGRTVQEWTSETRSPTAVADAFDALRYGGRKEPPSLRERGMAWVKQAWARWLS